MVPKISGLCLSATVDSGAGGLFIDETFAKQNDFILHELSEPLNTYNVDGMLNKKGTITSYVEADLKIGEQIKQTCLYVTGLGKQKSSWVSPGYKTKTPPLIGNPVRYSGRNRNEEGLDRKQLILPEQASLKERKHLPQSLNKQKP